MLTGMGSDVYNSGLLCDHLLPCVLFLPGSQDGRESGCNAGDSNSIIKVCLPFSGKCFMLA